VVAAQGEDAVIAHRAGNAVTLTGTPHQSLPEVLLRQIPDARPAPIHLPDVHLTETDPTEAARMLARLSRHRPIGQGELYVAVRDHYGRCKVSLPIRYQDYRLGRVLVTAADNCVSVVPATTKLLLARLREAYRAVTG
jgi:hypothetical protein